MRSRIGRAPPALLVWGAMFLPAARAFMAQPIPGPPCPLFPADSVFNADISNLPVHAWSATWMSNMTQHSNLHPDLGTFAQQYGIPINVAPPPSSAVTPTFLYNSESDHPTEGYPIDQNTFIEGGPGAPSGSDRHALVVSSTLCKLYEVHNLQNFTNGQTPQAGSGAVWNLNSNAMRPIGWTSADAAGLPMAPLLLRPDEILAGSITHAIRFTTHCTGGYIWPGSHNAGSCDTNFPPMGARFRLRGTFDISGFSANTQVVLRAFQHYGLLLADNGADWYFGGTTDNWWGTTAGDTVVSELKTIPAAQFDAVDESGMQAAAGSYASISCTGTPLFTSYFSWFDKASAGMVGDNIHVLNPGSVTANVTVSLSGASPINFSLVAGAESYATFPTGTIGGPVTVTSDQPVLASQRVQYYQTFNEVVARSAAQASLTSYFNWFDKASAGMAGGNIHLLNTSGSTAHITVGLPGAAPVTLTLPALAETYVTSAPGHIGGPVTVTSDQPVLSSPRVQYYQSFNETPSATAAQAQTSSHVIWFDKASQGMVGDNIHVLNTGSMTANVTVSLAGVSPVVFSLPAGMEAYVSFPARSIGGPGPV